MRFRKEGLTRIAALPRFLRRLRSDLPGEPPRERTPSRSRTGGTGRARRLPAVDELSDEARALSAADRGDARSRGALVAARLDAGRHAVLSGLHAHRGGPQRISRPGPPGHRSRDAPRGAAAGPA